MPFFEIYQCWIGRARAHGLPSLGQSTLGQLMQCCSAQRRKGALAVLARLAVVAKVEGGDGNDDLGRAHLAQP